MSDQKASDLLAECLENEGVEYIFGVPGEENLDFLDSLSRSKTIRLILTRHEQVAGFMAATYGRLTGKVGVCLATLGPGATNLVTAAAYAQLGAMPMLMITPSQVRNAFRLAEEERPGAVHLELPQDIARENTDARPIAASQMRRPIVEGKRVESKKVPSTVCAWGISFNVEGRSPRCEAT